MHQQCKVFTEFDDGLNIPLFGYGSVENYYKAATSSDKLHKISIPYICLTATDDPFVPEKCEHKCILCQIVCESSSV